MKISHTLGAGVVSVLAVTLTGCSVLQPEETGLGDHITVSSSEEAPYEAKDTDDKEVTSNLVERDTKLKIILGDNSTHPVKALGLLNFN